MYKTYKYRLNPTKFQASALENTLDLCRNLYNCALEQRRSQRIDWFEQKRQLTDLRAGIPDYRTVHVHVLQNVIRRLDFAFKRFFEGRATLRRVGFPRFKSKDRYHSFSFNNVGFSLTGNRLYISKIGSVKVRLSRPLMGTVKTCTIVRRSQHWYAYFAVLAIPSLMPKTSEAVGVDVGIENYAALSDGTFIPNPRFYEAAQRGLRRDQRRIARRKKGSRRRRKAVALCQRAHERIVNRRLDFLHKQARSLISRYGLIAIEKLSIKPLTQGFLSKQVQDASWRTFFNLLSYKAEEAGRELVEVDARYTSQTCPSCERRVRKPLCKRRHQCVCGFAAHRDTAAAKVILARAKPSSANVEELISCVA